MDEIIRQKFEGLSVVILGFGREGQASYTMIRRALPHQLLTIADMNDKVRQHSILAGDNNVSFITGEDYLHDLNMFDVILRSPGIPVWMYVESGPGSKEPRIPGEKITSQTDLFLQKFRNQVVGVTGTKGKSTTASLISHILKTAGKDVLLAGNIGNPLFHIADLIRPETIVVAELSSHQLEFLNTGSHIAVFLNLFQEHLDAYQSYEKYQQAKLNMVTCQHPGDYLVYNGDDPLVDVLVKPFVNQRNTFQFSLVDKPDRGTWLQNGAVWVTDGHAEEVAWRVHQDRFLKGEHNLNNIMAAINVSRIFNIGNEDIEDGIATFKGLEHRLEYVGEFQGIHFYNDSIATIPEACMAAVKSLPLVDTLVAGGFDRQIDYQDLGSFLVSSGVRTFILVGAAGRRIGEAMKRAGSCEKNIHYINRFDDFVGIAMAETAAQHVCLLSPAAASYDEFKNFEERGKRFRFLVQNKRD